MAKSDLIQKTTWEDRYLETSRLLKSYLSATEAGKQQYLQVVAGAAAACQPGIDDPDIENIEIAKSAADVAFMVVRFREGRSKDAISHVERLITDAYATVAIGYRRAAAVYLGDPDMQQLGTAAVHLLTMATSYMIAHSAD